ncbi:MAG: hypothetical protein ACR652_04265 [Methylocystis sp.]|uniref:hypothetical protein n=1 Tax=Methylocystis sp. TaxID=1911079 RepID=UPI003DA3443A
MRKRTIRVLCALGLAAQAALAFGAVRAEEMSFRLVGVNGNCGARCPQMIAAEGEIGEATPDAFVSFIAQNVGSGNLHGVVLLDSPGGKVVASMELGQAIRRLGMAVIVARPAAQSGGDGMALVSGRCYSACVYALMGGKKRVIPAQSRVGIHRMFNYSTSFDFSEGLVRERNYDDGGMRQMLARYASGMGVSSDLVTLAERTSPDQLYMLTGADIARWRLGTRKL